VKGGGSFQVPGGGCIEVIDGDITEQAVDAIVNPANPSLLGGGGADGAIHRAAGPGLREECRPLGGCRTGEAKITGGHRLPARFVIHTVGPVWRGGTAGEDTLLAACYEACLRLAGELRLSSIAFPAISTGAYGFPFPRAARIAVGTVLEILPEATSVDRVIFVCHGREAAETYRQVIAELLPPGKAVAGREGDPEEEVSGRVARDRIGAHLITIESAYGIRIANLPVVLDRIARATRDDREILAITTAISSYIAVHPGSAETEIPEPFLDQAIRRLTGR